MSEMDHLEEGARLLSALADDTPEQFRKDTPTQRHIARQRWLEAERARQGK